MKRTQTGTWEEHHVKMKGEVHEMLLEAQDCQRLPVNPQSYGSGPEWILLHSPQRDPTLQTLNFRCWPLGP